MEKDKQQIQQKNLSISTNDDQLGTPRLPFVPASLLKGFVTSVTNPFSNAYMHGTCKQL